MNTDTDIIIDIETLGTRPGCPIIEIGACAVETATGRIFEEFSMRVNPGIHFETVKAAGLGQDPYSDPHSDFAKTCAWWMRDTERTGVLAAIMNPVNEIADLRTALGCLRDWMLRRMPDPKRARVWGNGPSFDIAILDQAYRDNGIERPWICWQERCVRTALDLAGHQRGSVKWAEAGPRHRALYDARHEARKLWLSGALGAGGFIARQEREQIIAGLVSRGTITQADADRLLGKGA